jgi:cystathionine beta-lyase/cystathionine gamma-synthase
MSQERELGFGTKAVHAGCEPDPAYGAVMTPIYQTSTYAQEYPARPKDGYDYSRAKNPTRTALEASLAALEGGACAYSFASGLSAITAVLHLLEQGAHVVAGNDLYGGSRRLFERVFRSFGLDFTYVDPSSPANFEAAIRPNTRLIWVETPTNPLLAIADLAGIAAIGKARSILLGCDNTFATPYLQNPLAHGFDVVVHSTTKYLGGHSDVIGGAVILKDASLGERVQFLQLAVGAVPGPFDCFLQLRGIKTLHLRMARHCENARKVATWLRDHPRVAKVYYPGFESHPNHAVAKRQMRDFGGMVAFTLKASVEEAMAACTKTRVFTLAESLGGVESLIEHPPSMTHASIPEAERRKIGIDDGLIRLSVGIEDAADLIADLDRALR